MRLAVTATDGHIDCASIILRATAGPPAARGCTSTQSQLRSEPQSSPIFRTLHAGERPVTKL